MPGLGTLGGKMRRPGVPDPDSVPIEVAGDDVDVFSTLALRAAE
jgi:hypothetical protein